MTTMRFFAAARAAVGVDETTVDAETLDQALRGVDAVDAARWLVLQERCSYLVDGLSTRDRSTTLDGVGLVDVMPPFAGG
ncbi:MoaD/ThiS family protein [Curtobacterium sp. VKM Ac-2922]|nr:MoaD/ThiS family protein [Curtobacterium sp. VKM Ac-2922]MCJ1714244.1 MoaD/ThiS family protein [Curtobacterium sp. VKM Ac-2922]